MTISERTAILIGKEQLKERRAPSEAKIWRLILSKCLSNRRTSNICTISPSLITPFRLFRRKYLKQKILLTTLSRRRLYPATLKMHLQVRIVRLEIAMIETMICLIQLESLRLMWALLMW
jgi:hypothetical protein